MARHGGLATLATCILSVRVCDAGCAVLCNEIQTKNLRGIKGVDKVGGRGGFQGGEGGRYLADIRKPGASGTYKDK